MKKTTNIKYYYSWGQFDKDVEIIADKIKLSKKKFDGVFAPPRGGLPLAVMLSHKLHIPFLKTPKSNKTLVVDDIADTGETLNRFRNKNFIATLFYHKQSTVVPNIWVREKKQKWIIFPWEDKT